MPGPIAVTMVNNYYMQYYALDFFMAEGNTMLGRTKIVIDSAAQSIY